MKKWNFYLFLGILFCVGAITVLGVSLFQTWSVQDEPTREIEKTSVIDEVTSFQGTYVLYALNVHDWAHPEESATTVRHVIELHEQFQIPLEVFITDPLFQLYIQEDPDLIELLKTSPVVSVSYHTRAPTPYYEDFDWLGIGKMSKQERRETLLDYEEHALDLESGLPTDEPGGIEYMKQVIGYTPRMVGIMNNQTGGQLLADIYKEKGVQFCVKHDQDIPLGEQAYGLWVRPESYDLKLYEDVGKGKEVEEIFSEVQTLLSTDTPQFIGIKYHENNFYHEENPWFPVFWEDYRQKTQMFSPPYDLSKILNRFRSEEEQEAHWKLYEDSLAYLVAHPDEYRALNAVGLLEEFDWE
ncbi:hypothetical protein A2239_02390 [Candidatus Uhrbacteria bacterium RIFOXYA2_FULL_40_9]|nr:MAG: hypothetical protein A2239_02390 [Candidatus Uhrbacteria bacterium RIFOXYA2_FULL_40_9]OGL97585.1 MAG: hypothetical protein A2332_01060 [Candidatus Uhrbacteria bacterium RIFOXYB2_FULL_41_18]HBK35263.1 hypothetical protein [Candidatus Uhrbacteria bacterium]HCB56104.1 hypothetical protein [Candidatus Uhrbacteria bacterium]